MTVTTLRAWTIILLSSVTKKQGAARAIASQTHSTILISKYSLHWAWTGWEQTMVVVVSSSSSNVTSPIPPGSFSTILSKFLSNSNEVDKRNR